MQALLTLSCMLLLSIKGIAAQACLGITYGDCAFDAADVVAEYNLPGDTSAFVLCQDLCQADEECEYFKYDSSIGSCVLYAPFDELVCQTISGGFNPDVANCLPDPTSKQCKDVTEADCEFTAIPSRVYENVQTPTECQNLLNTVGPLVFASYFVHEADSQTCTLNTGPYRVCPAVVGPDLPDFDTECVAPGTTTEAPQSLRLVAGLGIRVGEGDAYLDDFESISVDTGANCDNFPPYPLGGQVGSVSAVLSGGILHVCGGFDDAVYTAECFSFQNGEWLSEPPMQVQREYAAADVTFDGRMLVTGGFNDFRNQTGSFDKTVEFYDPVSSSWTFGPDLPEGITEHCLAAFDGGTKFLLAGGYTEPGNSSSRAFVYDLLQEPNLGWVEIEGLSVTRRDHDCAEVGGEVLVAGGTADKLVEIYNPATGTWRIGTPMPQSRDGMRLVRWSPTELLAVGGYGDGLLYANAERYDAETEAWNSTNLVLQTGREDLVAELLPEAGFNLPNC